MAFEYRLNEKSLQGRSCDIFNIMEYLSALEIYNLMILSPILEIQLSDVYTVLIYTMISQECVNGFIVTSKFHNRHLTSILIYINYLYNKGTIYSGTIICN